MTDTVEFLAAASRIALGSGERLVWPDSLDADAVVSAADRHRMLIMLARALPSISAPAELQATVRSMVRERTERALLLVSQLRTLVAVLEAEGIEVYPVKGPVLAMEAYGDVAIRGASGDIDLVVRPSEFARSVAILEGEGYRRIEVSTEEHAPGDWSREAHLYPPSGSMGTLVDLHSELSGSADTARLDLDAVMARATRRALLGAELRVLAREDLLLYCALHAAQHIWSRLIWTADVAALIRRSKSFDWTAVLDRAAAIDARHRLAVTLRLAIDLFQAGVPDAVQSQLFTSPRVARTARLARSRMRRTSVGAKLRGGLSGLLHRARCELAVRETSEQRKAWLLWGISPSAPDFEVFALPRGLGWLRWVLRPFRVVYRHIRDGRRAARGSGRN